MTIRKPESLTSRPGYLIWEAVLLMLQRRHAAPAGVRQGSAEAGVQLQPASAR